MGRTRPAYERKMEIDADTGTWLWVQILYRRPPARCIGAGHGSGGQLAFAAAGHVQPDSAASQPQRLAHGQAAPPACGFGVAMPWQPQAQVLPGQLAHWQGEANRGFMACPFGSWRTRRVRGSELWKVAAPKA